MKVVYIFERPHPGAHSIRELFLTIAREAQAHADVVIYELSGPRALLRDVRRLRRLHGDIYHITGNVYYVAPFLPRGRIVLTVADIGHYLFGLKGWRRILYGWIWFRIPLRFATLVVAISDETRRNLVRYFNLREEEVTLIPCCVSPIFASSPAGQFNSSRPLILQVGTSGYKNVPRVVRALKGIQCELILVGRISPEIERALSESGIPWRNHIDIPHDAVAALYRQCDLVTFISIGEGFGVPILEAQAAGRPLITADVSPLREVAGEGACLVDPMDESSIRVAVSRVIEDAEYRQRLVLSGVANARKYAPAAIVARYLDTYAKVLPGQVSKSSTRTTP